MSNYLKPQSPLKNGENYIYPITTADQIVMDDGTRLNAEVSKHLKIDINNAESAEPNGINADSLGGYSADEYMRKDQASVEVNYSVVNNLTKPTDEADFTQNMIWIDTDAPIGRVFFGNNEPNETLIDGDIWIATGISSNVAFNSIKIGPAYMNMVYPLSAKQYINGVWVDMIVKSYQGEEWVDWWNDVLYEFGNQYEHITGGWQLRAWAGVESATAKTPTLTEKEDSVTISISSGNGKYYTGVYECIKDIDLTNYSTINIDCSGSASSTNTVSGAYLAITQRDGTYISSNRPALCTLVPKETSSVSRKIFQLSLDGIDNLWDVVVVVCAKTETSETASKINIYKIWLD